MSKCYIVGAGTGFLGHMTLEAYKLCTETAEVILYDRLVSQEILDIIPKDVKLIYVGKECGKHSMTQDEIMLLTLEYCQKYEHVVRLKGGDPMLFAHGGEEYDFLEKHNIKVSVTPGITAVQGLSARIGLALTQRSIASNVYFVTGHLQKNSEWSRVNWQSIAQGYGTVVIYMGIRNIETIYNNLITYGLDKDTPVTIAHYLYNENEQILFCNLENILSTISKNNIKSPSIIVIGHVLQKFLKNNDNT